MTPETQKDRGDILIEESLTMPLGDIYRTNDHAHTGQMQNRQFDVMYVLETYEEV